MLDSLRSPQWLADYLGVPLATLYQWSSRRTGPRTIRVGRHLRYRQSDIDRWLEAQCASDGVPGGVTVHGAIELALNGWSVLPLHGKVPYTAHGVHDATKDPDTIRSWWCRWPHANIGAKVPASLLVLDIDPRHGGSIQGLGPLPPTLTCWSGRGDGGRHLYFARPYGPLTPTRLPVGVDLKRNGYCVVPPSLHPTTDLPYRWELGDIAALPIHLRDLLRPEQRIARPGPRGTGTGTGAARALVAVISRHVTHGVNDALYWAACRAAEQNVLDQLTEELVAAAVDVGESDVRARATVQSARRRVTAP